MTHARLKTILTKGNVDSVDLKEIKDEEFNSIAQLLDMEKNRSTLTSIDASNSGLESTSLNKLCNIIAKCPKLKTLNLSNSKISKVSAARLEEALKENKELNLNLNQSLLKEELFKEKLTALSDYPHLSKYLKIKMPKSKEDVKLEEDPVDEEDWVRVLTI